MWRGSWNLIGSPTDDRTAGSHPVNLDTDGDSFLDGGEVDAGLDPRDRRFIPGCDLWPGVDLRTCPPLHQESFVGLDLIGAILDGLELRDFDYTDTVLATASMDNMIVAESLFVRTDSRNAVQAHMRF